MTRPFALAKGIVEGLGARGLTLALAESCTGGGIAGAITAVPGASGVFKGGVVAYTPAAKMTLLGLTAAELPPGCVGEELTRKMAERIRELLQADLALAITGALGPASPHESIQVGRVHICLVKSGYEESRRFFFSGNRQTMKRAAVNDSLNCLLQFIAGWNVAKNT